jgi:putative inorganic carbon (hco3(-)) transporter
MSVRTVLFFLGFIICSGGALKSPIFGVAGYMLQYSIGTESWWMTSLNHLGIRYSYILALMTGIGVILNWKHLRFGESLLVKQEKIALLFLVIVWISVLIGGSITSGHYDAEGLMIDPPSIKITKYFIFAFILTHVVVNVRSINIIFWIFIISALFLGYSAYQAPPRAFVAGRLENIGGPDFRQANDLAVYLAAMMPITGVMFLRTNWFGKIVCAAAGVLSLNAIVLTRSRTGLVAVVASALTITLFAPRRYRVLIIFCLIIAGIGFVSLMDTRYINRSGTIVESSDNPDSSVQGRFKIWNGGIRMAVAKPLGVGAGNFYQNIGKYAPQFENRDAHNTYIRCVCELGWHGLIVMIILIVNAFLMLKSIMRKSDVLPRKICRDFQMIISAASAALAVYVVSGMGGTMLYIEAFWWFLLLPVCLLRCFDNLHSGLPVEKVLA